MRLLDSSIAARTVHVPALVRHWPLPGVVSCRSASESTLSVTAAAGDADSASAPRTATRNRMARHYGCPISGRKRRVRFETCCLLRPEDLGLLGLELLFGEQPLGLEPAELLD